MTVECDFKFLQKHLRVGGSIHPSRTIRFLIYFYEYKFYIDQYYNSQLIKIKKWTMLKLKFEFKPKLNCETKNCETKK